MSKWLETLDQIKAAREEFSEFGEVWYRGQHNNDWHLIPSLHRYSNGLLKERDLFNKFSRHANSALTPKGSAWETLFDMQHYYVPTRLLDWTEVVGVATYFALMSEPDNPCIWVLSPQKLNTHSLQKSEIKKCDDSDFEYKKVFWDKNPVPAVNPIAIEPLLLNKRITAQRGMFTVHGTDARGLDEIYPDCVKKIEIPTEAIPEAIEYLEFADINGFSLFPDIEGLAPFLKEMAGLES